MQLACGVRFLAGAAAAKEPAQFVFEPSKAKEEADKAKAAEDDPLAGLSDDDDFLTRPPSSDEDDKDPETANLCLATYERVARSKGTWKVQLRNGMMD